MQINYALDDLSVCIKSVLDCGRPAKTVRLSVASRRIEAVAHSVINNDVATSVILPLRISIAQVIDRRVGIGLVPIAIHAAGQVSPNVMLITLTVRTGWRAAVSSIDIVARLGSGVRILQSSNLIICSGSIERVSQNIIRVFQTSVGIVLLLNLLSGWRRRVRM